MATVAEVRGLETAFAPAERAPEAVIRAAARRVERDPLLAATLDASGIPVAVLNPHRQIVHANRPLLDLLGASCCEEVLGLRPGEAMGCAHAHEGPGGCGTGRACAFCGAVLAILAADSGGQPVTRECRLLVQREDGPEAAELEVTATPLEVHGHRFTVVAMRDRTAEHRRDALERIFFHDLLNSLGGVVGWTRVLNRVADGRARTVARRLAGAVRELEEEIRAQRDLAAAEAGRLEPGFEPVEVDALLDRLAERFSGHPVAAGRRLVIRRLEGAGVLETDAALALRVLGNMVKNALEATPEGGAVRLSVEADPLAVSFHVANDAVMPPEVQLQLFHRSFSTKGPGRGLGTWSMKLLGERYLHGRVTFTSREGEGTVFTFTLPRRPPTR